MQPIAFQGFVKVGKNYFNSEKITKIKEYKKGEAPTIIFYDNGTVENFAEIRDTTKFVQLLNTSSATNSILNYEA